MISVAIFILNEMFQIFLNVVNSQYNTSVLDALKISFHTFEAVVTIDKVP